MLDLMIVYVPSNQTCESSEYLKAVKHVQQLQKLLII